MRRFLILATMVTLILGVAGVTTGTALANSGPFLPGDSLFPIQYFAEQQQARLISDPQQRTAVYFNFVERRLEAIVARTGTGYEIDALRYFDTALEQAILSASTLPDRAANTFKNELLSLVELAEVAISLMQTAPAQNPDVVIAFQAKLSTLQALLADPNLSTSDLGAMMGLSEEPPVSDDNPHEIIALNPMGQTDPQLIPFPANSPAGAHEFFPLVGQHALIDCTDCHADGVYEGTPTLCESCHTDDEPANHYDGDCAACHTPTNWEDATFDHSLVDTSNCASCHSDDQPPNHYGNQCAACHITSSWEQASFDHKAVGATDCKSCHNDDKPENHYGGQCSKCHSTSSWEDANFDHTGKTDCQSCHNDDKPENHFNGQCSDCHSTSSWEDANFDHTGKTTCRLCHNEDKPANHYLGQCSDCHSTNTWEDANFDHTGKTNCKSCHNDDKPENHFNGQCSDCHSTSTWEDANFDHTGKTNCKSCHDDDKPENHYDGQCSNCHNTDHWDDVEFNHDGQTDCISCHAKDRPKEHSNAQCSWCHNTSSWDDHAGDDDENDSDKEGKGVD